MVRADQALFHCSCSKSAEKHYYPAAHELGHQPSTGAVQVAAVLDMSYDLQPATGRVRYDTTNLPRDSVCPCELKENSVATPPGPRICVAIMIHQEPRKRTVRLRQLLLSLTCRPRGSLASPRHLASHGARHLLRVLHLLAADAAAVLLRASPGRIADAMDFYCVLFCSAAADWESLRQLPSCSSAFPPSTNSRRRRRRCRFFSRERETPLGLPTFRWAFSLLCLREDGPSLSCIVTSAGPVVCSGFLDA